MKEVALVNVDPEDAIHPNVWEYLKEINTALTEPTQRFDPTTFCRLAAAEAALIYLMDGGCLRIEYQPLKWALAGGTIGKSYVDGKVELKNWEEIEGDPQQLCHRMAMQSNTGDNLWKELIPLLSAERICRAVLWILMSRCVDDGTAAGIDRFFCAEYHGRKREVSGNVSVENFVSQVLIREEHKWAWLRQSPGHTLVCQQLVS